MYRYGKDAIDWSDPIDWADPQAMGLSTWWPMWNNPGIGSRTVNGFGKVAIDGLIDDTSSGPTYPEWKPTRHGHFGVHFIENPGQQITIGNWPRTPAYPYSFLVMAEIDAFHATIWPELISGGGNNSPAFGYKSAAAGGNLFWAENSAQWQENGPVLQLGEFVVVGVAARGKDDFDLIQVSETAGLEKTTHTGNGYLPSIGSWTSLLLGRDQSSTYVMNGRLFDVRIHVGIALPDAVYRAAFNIGSRFGLAKRRRMMAYRVPAAAAAASSGLLLRGVG